MHGYLISIPSARKFRYKIFHIRQSLHSFFTTCKTLSLVLFVVLQPTKLQYVLHFKTIILLSSTYECFEFQPYCTLENNLLNSTLQRVNVYIPDFDRVIVYFRPWSSNKEIWDLGYVHFLAITGRKKSRIPCFKHSASTYYSRTLTYLKIRIPRHPNQFHN